MTDTVYDKHIKDSQELKQVKNILANTIAPRKHHQHKQAYRDLAELNNNGLILRTVGKEILERIVFDFVDLLETSAAVYEKNGDYAFGIFSSGWCRLLDEASYKLCKTNDPQTALDSGQWHCHESCWSRTSKRCIEESIPVNTQCSGGICLYGVPIYANQEIIGSINFGYGNPPTDSKILKTISENYQLDLNLLEQEALKYQSRPDYIIELAKVRLQKAADLIGTIVERKLAEEALEFSEAKFKQIVKATWEGIVIHENGKILQANQQYYDMFGYCPEEIQDQDAISLTAAPESIETIKKNITAGNLGPYQVTGRRKDGSTFPMEIRVKQIEIPGRHVRFAAIRDITEQKKTECTIREREETLNSIFRAAPVGIGMVVNRVIVKVNDRLCEMLGYKQNELINQNARMLYPTQQDYEYVGTEKYKQIKEHGTGTVETRWQRKDGRIIEIILSSTPLDVNDHSKGVTFTALDITKRKFMEHALRESEQQFRNVVQSSPMGIFMYELRNENDLILINSNQAANTYTKIDNQRRCGMTIEEAFPGLAKTEIPDIYRRIARQGDTWNTEDLFYDDGQIKGYYDIKAFQTSPGRMAVLFIEVSERREAKKALQDSEERFRHFFEMDLIGMTVMSNDKKWLLVNDFLCEMLGYNRDELLQKTWDEITHPEDIAEEKQAYEDMLNDRIKKYVLDKRFIKKNGNTVYASISVSPVRRKNRIDYVIAVIQDITKRKKGEIERIELLQSLDAKNKELESIVYISSHDLRSPLVNIQGFSSELIYSCQQLNTLLEQFDLKPSEKEKVSFILTEDIPSSLHYITESTKKMDMLLRGLLEISRIGRKSLKIKSINTNNLFDDILRTMLYQIQIADITITRDELPTCIADEGELNQVFTNLLDNAVKYMNPESKRQIHVSGKIEGNQSIYCFEDTGIGIDQEHIKIIFEIFHRLNPHDNIHGQGLGLTIVQRIMERNNGKIWAESTIGKGSRFYVALPR